MYRDTGITKLNQKKKKKDMHLHRADILLKNHLLVFLRL